MTYRLFVPGINYEDTPKWWQNFRQDAEFKVPRYDTTGRYERSVYDILESEHNGTYVDDLANRNMDYIEFETEEDATFFILKWS